ncbi:hypothetical protein AK812_SmicGene31245 [Symbiodinium microadriaticum]|uniref:Uncharacterized protein n=1 Tax=Symbiodinium microadriaticum TaxID=2951 RepID=A0A1Q9CX63_SYMMI|nr:hypothetical protein AK812_SmicGene31245 [Symbiodinium microadriaticum]
MSHDVDPDAIQRLQNVSLWYKKAGAGGVQSAAKLKELQTKHDTQGQLAQFQKDAKREDEIKDASIAEQLAALAGVAKLHSVLEAATVEGGGKVIVIGDEEFDDRAMLKVGEVPEEQRDVAKRKLYGFQISVLGKSYWAFLRN